MSQQKGITLVALIITIVVLLILAVVAIGAVTDSNIIGHAGNAASVYNQAKDNEVQLLSKYESKIEEYVPKEGATVTYADFWKTAYEKIGIENKAISNHSGIMFKEIGGQVCGFLFYGDFPSDFNEGEPSIDPDYRYFMCMINDSGTIFGSEVKANQWYSCTRGSDIDFSTVLSLPEEISTNKSGTPFSGYEDLCELFDKAVGTEGCTPYVPN